MGFAGSDRLTRAVAHHARREAQRRGLQRASGSRAADMFILSAPDEDQMYSTEPEPNRARPLPPTHAASSRATKRLGAGVSHTAEREQRDGGEKRGWFHSAATVPATCCLYQTLFRTCQANVCCAGVVLAKEGEARLLLRVNRQLEAKCRLAPSLQPVPDQKLVYKEIMGTI